MPDNPKVSALGRFRVLELAEGVAGEYCGKLLSDFGADVIKVERPGGSPTRALGPLVDRGPVEERSGLFAYLNTNKRSIILDFSNTEDLGRFRNLLAEADVVIDDHAPGWLESLGLAEQQVIESHPKLICCAITGFGQEPPDDRVHVEDLTVFHSSGWGYHTPGGVDESRPPLKGAGRFLASYEAGLDGALCVVSSLFERESSEKGRFIDIAKQQVLASRLDYVLGQMVVGDMDVTPRRSAFDLGGPAAIFPCREGHVYFWAALPAEWKALGELLGKPDWMREFPEHWLEKECTPERVAQCRHHLGDWFRTQDHHEVSVAAQKMGIFVVPINGPLDLLRSPQYEFRNYFTKVNHPVLGTVRHPTVGYRLSETPVTISRHSPLLGEHDDAVFGRPQSLPAPSPPKGYCDGAEPIARGGPLQGVRVVELTKVWAGPYAGRQLACLGAEVIKVESLNSLDTTRYYATGDIDKAPGFRAVNPQKMSVQIDMKTQEGIDLILDLIGKADIVIENLRPGAVKRLGLGYEAVKAVNPEIVYVSMSMHGTEGPLSYQTGYAPAFSALSGVTSAVGYDGGPPTGMNIRYGDATFGTTAAYAAAVALMHRRSTGRGQFVDVSAAESLSSVIPDIIMDFTLLGHTPQCDGNRHPEMVPHGVYPCRDGDWIAMAVRSDEQFRALARAMGQPEIGDQGRFKSLAHRRANEEELNSMIAAWTGCQDARYLESYLQRCGIAAAKSANSIDLVADQHLWDRGFFPTVVDQGEERSVVGSAWKMTRAARLCSGAPRLGEHTSRILGEILGLSDEDICKLGDTKITY